MKHFFSGTAGKVTIVTAVLLLVLCVFLAKTMQEEKKADIEPAQAMQEWTQDGLPVFVDFTADWCSYCREMEPVIEELREEYRGKVSFETVDIDRQKKLAKEFGVASVPFYLLLSADGEPIAYYPGAVEKETLASMIDDGTAGLLSGDNE